MGLRSRLRKARSSQEELAHAFWQWWQDDAADRICAGTDGFAPAYIKRLNQRIARISPGLAWELGAGTVAEHALVIFAEQPDQAALARRVLKAAPAPDIHWEYADTRRAAVDFEELTLGIAGQDFAAEDFRVRLLLNRYSADIAVYHPHLALLPGAKRMLPVSIMLDHAIGQADAAAWIRIVEPVLQPHADDIPLGGLREVVDRLRAGALDEHGQPIWEELHGVAADGEPITAVVQVPLAPTFWPDFDQHVAIRLDYRTELGGGQPGGRSAQRLQQLENALAAALGPDGRLVAVETTAGRRTLHFYVDSTTSAAWQLEAGAVAWTEGPVGTGSELDPSWSSVRHLRLR
ncbi:hypothetical protein D477_010191 [Arthrobacter crystallopoietes BAB-32]|uniref:DUF695 domain-containing protein n=1 Tax=Arthrobacter crystallopoietes BAB-32 TaxID=1246476 RepID=N1V7W2_9MICC|nr:DUF695 domain-containing protein [Arthrobacter crystallopoietes]EMY34313.1 hypothetical protein D477_010191 [Arthrobacter crystallopoietes BAB-32]